MARGSARADRNGDGAWTNTEQTGDEWLAGLRRGTGTFREPLTNVIVTSLHQSESSGGAPLEQSVGSCANHFPAFPKPPRNIIAAGGGDTAGNIVGQAGLENCLEGLFHFGGVSGDSQIVR